jgi:hypothetical protein
LERQVNFIYDKKAFATDFDKLTADYIPCANHEIGYVEVTTTSTSTTTLFIPAGVVTTTAAPTSGLIAGLLNGTNATGLNISHNGTNISNVTIVAFNGSNGSVVVNVTQVVSDALDNLVATNATSVLSNATWVPALLDDDEDDV